jgi:hypothetical protein
MLTGCVQLEELTDKESDMMAEYMAGAILKNDTNYEDALTYPDEIKKLLEANTDKTLELGNSVETADSSETVASTETNSTETTTSKEEQSQDSVIDMNLTTEMGNGKFSITYSDYTFYDSYPSNEDNNYFTLETSSDRQLLIISFDIKNVTRKKANFNLIKSNFKYQLDINTGTIYKPMMTLLVNDIQYINLDISAGKTNKAVIVFDVYRDVDMSNINLIISNQDKTSIIKVK